MSLVRREGKREGRKGRSGAHLRPSPRVDLIFPDYPLPGVLLHFRHQRHIFLDDPEAFRLEGSALLLKDADCLSCEDEEHVLVDPELIVCDLKVRDLLVEDGDLLLKILDGWRGRGKGSMAKRAKKKGKGEWKSRGTRS